MKKIRQTIKGLSRTTLFFLSFALLALIGSMGIQIAQAAWQEPQTQAPEGNLYAPLNVGPDMQTKKGRLLLDPFYDANGNIPTINNQLEVLGGGAFFTNLEAVSTLRVDTDTLYVSASGTGLGTVSPTSRLQIMSGRLKVTSTEAANTPAVLAISTTDNGVAGTAQGSGVAGVYGTSTAGYGIYGDNEFGGYGVYGKTGDAIAPNETTPAIQGSTTAAYNSSSIIAALYGQASGLGAWAGYFEQRVYGSDKVVGRKFVPNRLQNSLIPYTAGQKLRDVAVSQPMDMVFDGTYIWTVNVTGTTATLDKFSASDSFKIAEYTYTVTAGATTSQITYDGTSLWVSAPANLMKINPITGSRDLNTAVNGGTDLAFDGTALWLTRSGASNNLLRISRTTGLVTNTYSVGTDPSQMAFDGTNIWTVNTTSKTVSKKLVSDTSLPVLGFDFVALNNLTPQVITFDGTYLWVGTTAADADGNSIFKIKASDGTLAGKYNLGTSVNNVRGLVFDGINVWATSRPAGSSTYLSRIVSTTGQVMTAAAYGDCSASASTAFDGNHIWTADQTCNGTTNLHQFYSGSGRGLTDLFGSVLLQSSTPGMTQSGSFSINGSATIGTNLIVVGNLVVSNNVWGGADSNKNYGIGCDNGQFAKSVSASGIVCRRL